ncbi:MAG: phosphoribosylformylglycinamidine synthase II, partial [Paracoccaceae bacterium]|nr:phosphoribosylformylglycinamidine synthase II [Paracoccaceae bacterium]
TGILPTPTIGAVGLLKSLDDMIAGLPREGELAVVIGETTGHLGQSALLAEVFNREDGDAPHVDLDAERRNGTFLQAQRALFSAATDLSDGGLALAAFEMAAAAGMGMTLENTDTGLLFGEDQARYLVACSFDQAEALMVAAGHAGVPIAAVGRFGGHAVRLGPSEAPLTEMSALYRESFARAVG